MTDFKFPLLVTVSEVYTVSFLNMAANQSLVQLYPLQKTFFESVTRSLDLGMNYKMLLKKLTGPGRGET